ncbi:ASX DEUBAD domain-containing protein [Plasmodiophora brassicae]
MTAMGDVRNDTVELKRDVPGPPPTTVDSSQSKKRSLEESDATSGERRSKITRVASDRSSPDCGQPRQQLPFTVDSCKVLSLAERRRIVTECYEYDPLSDQMDKIQGLSPEFMSMLTPAELQMCDRLPKMCLARQIQLYRYVRTFGERFGRVWSTSSPESLNNTVQYLVGQVSRLLEDDMAAVSRCRTSWINQRFQDLQASQLPSISGTKVADISKTSSAFRRVPATSTSLSSASSTTQDARPE